MSMGIKIRCTYVNKTRGSMIGEDPDFVEPFTQDRGELYKDLMKEYGRCSSKMYREVEGQPDKAVGWVFEGRDKYGDTGETYLREVWVEVATDEEIRAMKVRRALKGVSTLELAAEITRREAQAAKPNEGVDS